ncbi:hypothetical protein BCR36DRAFT_586584 [Piromyces finnis]|uniref:CBM10 domain-containing protein n=1 Tax=Piromyces finnis TaxID=1754191 RepID=A0A1Y1V0Z9_9FUNG|nr:hypothetical protein BCR36DRAFT_586584 [Piromyces finnis]|eukprot:ORX43651.1 hypothetical protein BCR36DRAFT_586584 [Piromyces finnis]
MSDEEYQEFVKVAQLNYENIVFQCEGDASCLPDFEIKTTIKYELDGKVKTFKKATVKTGGNWSRTNDRVGFNIKLKDDDRLFDQKYLRLRPDPTDFTVMRTKLSMELLYRFNVPTLQSAYVEVYVNDIYFGLFLLQSTIKPEWIQQEYELPENVEMKGLFNCKKDSADLNAESKDHCFNAVEEYANYTQPLDEFITSLDNAKSVEELRKVFNVDLFMKNVVFEYLVGSYDHYVTNGHNYFVYQKENGIWDLILNDFDNTFGNNLFVSYVYAMGNDPIDITEAPFEKLVKRKKHLLDLTYFDDKNKTLFKKTLRELLVTGFNEEFLFNRIEEIKKIILPYVKKTITPNDDGTYPGAINLIGQPSVHTLEEFEESFTVTSEDQFKIGLKNWISKRIAFACKSYGFDIDEINKEAAEYNKTGKYSPKEEPIKEEPIEKDECWSSVFGYECCENCNVIESDEHGDWGVKNGEWCGIKTSLCKTGKEGCPKTDYPCCSHCNVSVEDKTSRWGVENGEWCTINFSC